VASCNAQELLDRYDRKALPSFDVGGGNVDFLEAAFEAAEKSGRGMYLSSTPSTVQSYLGFEGYVSAIQMVAKRHPGVDYAIHLDHSKELKFVEEALQAGFRSVMYDGSHLSFEENVENTKKALAWAKAKGATLECELGTISGKEDEIEEEGEKLPTFEEISRFVSETAATLTAPAIGTVHGHFKGEPRLNWAVVDQMKDLNGNFVLHGCTGLDPQILTEFARRGWVKFNFATALRDEFRQGLVEHLEKHPKDLKPFTYLKAGRSRLSSYMSEIFGHLDPKE
tara:strand:- start:2122 stop:2967 length:846 start_codon:yes stop_codon:yes gene_type:complete